MTERKDLNQVLAHKEDILNVFYTAGFPQADDTLRIAIELEKSGVDMIEIGLPFSDPIADGPVIQMSSQQALANGMNLSLLFEQLKDLRAHVQIPVLLMGYFNPVMQFGVEKFCTACEEVGIDGVIIPDLPMKEYLDEYKDLFSSKGLSNVFLISPITSEERIRLIDDNTTGFIYMVASSSITGVSKQSSEGQLAYYQRIKEMNLKNPRLIGFGIADNTGFKNACQYANGAIVGSAFIHQLSEDASPEGIKGFVNSIKGK